MSNFFQQASGDFSKFKKSVMGPDYKYYKFIKNPQEMGMSSKGNMDALSKDVAGLTNYTKLLISGTGPANKAGGRPLGNRFFLKTGGQCEDAKKVKQHRYIYIDNVPTGSIPFISSAMGDNFSSLRGLVPGTIDDVAAMSPLGLITGFMQGTTPKCSPVRLTEIDSNNQITKPKTRYIANSDILQMDPCTFGGKLPIPNSDGTYTTRSGCVEDFVGSSKISNKKKNFANIYTLGVSGLLLYILYKMHTR